METMIEVLSSPVGGTSWLPLGSNLTEREYSFDTNGIIGGDNIRFRVLASSGIDTGTAISNSVRVVQSPQLSAPVNTVYFKNLLVGESDARTIEFSNSGTGQLLVRITAPANALFKLESDTAYVLGPGESASVQVRFTPTAEGSQQAVLRIGDRDVTLRGAAFTSDVASIEPRVPAVDLGHVQTGTTKTVSFPVTNTGRASLSRFSVTASGPGFSAVTTFLSLAPGQTGNISVRLTNAAAGVQNGQITVTSSDPARNQVQLSLTATGVNGPVPAVLPGGVGNSANYVATGVAPGEIVVIFGSNLGPPALAGIALTPEGKVSTLVGETRVLFDGIPAPMVYAFAGQTAAVVPYAVSGNLTTKMVVEYQGRRSDPVELQVVPAVPGLFSANSSGTGQGAILHADYSVNNAGHPVAPGEYILLFGTGEGATSPEVEDGAVIGTTLPRPRAPVTVTIGGVNAEVAYAGGAPGLVAGVIQVNAKVPLGLAPGDHPVVMKVGGLASQPGLTVAVK